MSHASKLLQILIPYLENVLIIIIEPLEYRLITFAFVVITDIHLIVV